MGEIEIGRRIYACCLWYHLKLEAHHFDSFPTPCLSHRARLQIVIHESFPETDGHGVQAHDIQTQAMTIYNVVQHPSTSLFGSD